MDNDDDDNKKPRGYYPFDKLEIYHLAVRFREIVKQIFATFPNLDPEDVSQLNRSSKSMIRNTCEGAGETRPGEKARFYRMALRSSSESGGTLRLMEDEVGAHPLFNLAHEVNYEYIAKATNISRRKRR